MVKKVLTWALIAFAIFFVVTRPQGAANMIKSLGGGLKDIAVSFGDFFASLVT
jgi:hypothetical protein